MTIDQFLQILLDRELVPESIVSQVRKKVAAGDRRITPKSLLKYLVQKEIVTKDQAKQLLLTTLTVTPRAESSIMGIIPMPKVPPQPKPTPEPEDDEDIPTIAPLEEEVEQEDDDGGLVTDDDLATPVKPLLESPPSSLVQESLSKIGVGDETLHKAIEAGKPDPTQRRSKQKNRERKSEWDSSLLLYGGGGLILLVLIGGLIFYLLTRENADAILSEASSFFEGGSYTQAIKQYERFVENHPNHPEFSESKVKLGLARIWKATSSSSTNYSPALETTQEALQYIEDEPDFQSVAQRDLASLLPKIAQGLANQAEKSDDPAEVAELVKQTNTALAFCTNTKYIPKTFRDEVLLEEVNQTLLRVERARAQNAGLAEGLANIQQAIDQGDTAAAYQVHTKLLDEFPGLINDERLAAKVEEISAAEASTVKYLAEKQPADTQPRPREVVAEIALAERSGPTVPGVAGTLVVRIDGAIYGISASDGGLQWRNYVGIAPRSSPVLLASEEVLVVDTQHHELQKLEAVTGELVWRHQFESEILQPVQLGSRLLVTEETGKIHVLDLASGDSEGFLQFAQSLPVPPTVDEQNARIYVLGEHSSLYTLAADDFQCLGVFFLGHTAGSVNTPAVCVLNKVAVAVAKGLSTTHLELIDTNDRALPTARATTERLEGLVNTPLLVSGRRLVTLTSQGEVVVHEFNASTGKDSVTRIAAREPDRAAPVARFGLLSGSDLWVAGSELNKLTILPTSNRLQAGTIDNDYRGSQFDQPLQTSGKLLLHVRRPRNQAGAIVAAMEISSGRAQWETHLAVPAAGAAAVDSAAAKIHSVSATGGAFVVDRNAMRSRVSNQALVPSGSRNLPAFDQALDLGGAKLLASAPGSNTLLYLQNTEQRDGLKSIELAGPLSCPPMVWNSTFVVPTQTGQVYLFNSETGEQAGSPFQPAISPGTSYQWLTPAVVGSGDDSQLILSDGVSKVYLLSRASGAQPHLTASAEADLETAPLTTGFAVVGNLAVAGTEDGSVAALELPALNARTIAEVQGPITWGPYSLGESCLLATASEELVCLDSSGELSWKQALTHGPLTGQPQLNGSEVTLLSQQGVLSRVSIADGQQLAQRPLPQPVVAGPVAFGSRWIVTSHDGTLLVVDQP